MIILMYQTCIRSYGMMFFFQLIKQVIIMKARTDGIIGRVIIISFFY